jgi:hypothetical protein
MPGDDPPVTLVEIGDVVVVIAPDAEAAGLAAEELNRAGTKTAIFVGSAGPEAEEFCSEMFRRTR